MTTTGQDAWCVTWLLTEPSRSLANPPLPRDPTTSMSASCESLTSSSAASPTSTADGDLRRRFAGFTRHFVHEILDCAACELRVIAVLGIAAQSPENPGDGADGGRVN